jgi:hypothetical protein
MNILVFAKMLKNKSFVAKGVLFYGLAVQIKRTGYKQIFPCPVPYLQL